MVRIAAPMGVGRGVMGFVMDFNGVRFLKSHVCELDNYMNLFKKSISP